MGNDDLIQTQFENGVLCITLNRPKVNAFNTELVSATQHSFRLAERNPDVRCVVLTGSGNVFSAGQELTEFLQTGISYRYHLLRTYNQLVLQMRQLPKPVLVAVNGAVSGAALGVALAGDLRIASTDARFVVGFSGIGLAPDSAVSLLLPSIIGLGRATEFTFTNAPISAEQALAWGLVNRISPSENLLSDALAWAGELAQGAVRALGYAKRLFNKAILPDLETVLDYEAYMQEVARRNPEHHEGVAAFLEKRPAKFT